MSFIYPLSSFHFSSVLNTPDHTANIYSAHIHTYMMYNTVCIKLQQIQCCIVCIESTNDELTSVYSTCEHRNHSWPGCEKNKKRTIDWPKRKSKAC